MSNDDETQSLAAPGAGLPVWWTTVGLFAALVALADGFWITSVQGAIGVVQRGDSPVGRWLRDTAITLPVHSLAVLAALLLARRCVGNNRHGSVRAMVAALLLIALCTTVAAVELAMSARFGAAAHLADPQHPSHTGVARADVRTRAVVFGAVAMLLTNVVLVGWAVVLRSDRLWRRTTPSPTKDLTAVPEWSVA